MYVHTYTQGRPRFVDRWCCQLAQSQCCGWFAPGHPGLREHSGDGNELNRELGGVMNVLAPKAPKAANTKSKCSSGHPPSVGSYNTMQLYAIFTSGYHSQICARVLYDDGLMRAVHRLPPSSSCPLFMTRQDALRHCIIPSITYHGYFLLLLIGPRSRSVENHTDAVETDSL